MLPIVHYNTIILISLLWLMEQVRSYQLSELVRVV